MVIQTSSAGYKGGDFAEILVNNTVVDVGKNEKGHARGLHIVIINSRSGEIQTAKVFDTYSSSESFQEFTRKEILEGCVVVAACKDDCATKLSQEAK